LIRCPKGETHVARDLGFRHRPSEPVGSRSLPRGRTKAFLQGARGLDYTANQTHGGRVTGG
jgi:hypothetical protein